MNRSASREEAFKLLYSLEIQKRESVEEQIQIYLESNEINVRETRILFDEIGNLCNRYEIAEQQKQSLLLQREKDIEKARKKIINSYSKKLTLNENSITSVKEELNTFERLLVKYSTFNLDLIGNILQQLISITESEEYLYKQVSHTFKKRVHGVMDSWDEDVKTIVNIIITLLYIVIAITVLFKV